MSLVADNGPLFDIYWVIAHSRIQNGGGGQGDRSQNIGFLSNTSLDPLKHHNAAKPAFNDGPSSARQRNAIRWRADDGRLIVVF